ncbi:hypothetical protein X760_16615 [Mesorhizobium sp. LSHC422A00]|nr:hypothetical protein X760_16615 [Mesorhizobium sp. LSHC422A00]
MHADWAYAAMHVELFDRGAAGDRQPVRQHGAIAGIDIRHRGEPRPDRMRSVRAAMRRRLGASAPSTFSNKGRR